MTNMGINIVRDGVQRIELAMSDCKFSLEQLEAIKKIFELALEKTNRTIEKAKSND